MSDVTHIKPTTPKTELLAHIRTLESQCANHISEITRLQSRLAIFRGILAKLGQHMCQWPPWRYRIWTFLVGDRRLVQELDGLVETARFEHAFTDVAEEIAETTKEGCGE